ncbi:hypothetical protein CCR83_07505 [Rhodobacter veldkampii DSM 11550]|uniref:Lipoprotein n=1 Tax=Phaeovulum veldkampii DSM 11550 TaxID=1185920 RepID=A0A2T4JMD5_9RHOB|nr:hypothetical protein [Phaeovulum veldkampii]MBK5946285.1 hypothetical protein [Phaeovulum veldkampii DSM 11550]NCU20339.1 hypothetical protein [Candidatus Falkowbacteria bacterium]PTE19071.1 hypothetical protein C5F46_01160 [Phaeovulum veldkampii DSM 11550]TDQ61377.1 hypothetical protein EV658_10491 [Phaeovulum veldkampii DSM 11550]
MRAAAVIIVLVALAGCREGGAERLEPVGEARIAAERTACEARGGTWRSMSGGALQFCQRQTRDGGKACTRESDCEGACLARSGSCSPIAPLSGCNEVLTNAGLRVTECVQ